jgi:osmotically-inducible protein OsmY
MKTDEQLQQDVSAELVWEPSVHAGRIGVQVARGVVTLVGQVDSYREKWHAEQAAQRVTGVQALAVELTVQLPGPHQRSDADIARTVASVLAWSAAVPAGTLQVMVEHGWVTLSGEVDQQHQRQAVSDSVSYLMGVIGINNQITLKPAQVLAAQPADIEAALQRTSISQAQAIHVGVQGSRVTLGGTVHSWADRQTALNSAWGTPGVSSVVDQLQWLH